MAGVIFELDPVSEDAANVPLVLVDNSTYFLTGMDFPEPEVDQSTVSSVSTEGELPVSARHHNTTGTINLRVVGSTAAALQTALNYIDKKLAKIMREGGTLKCTTPAGSTYVSDLLSGALAVQFSRRYVTSSKADVTITLARRPYWRGAEQTLSTHSETTLPVLIFTVGGPSLPASYTAAVSADSPYAWWRFGESSGTAAADQQSADAGTYTGGFTLSQAGAISGDTNKAVAFNGSTGEVTTATSQTIPQPATLECWFKTTTASGGGLVGHFSNQTGVSASSGGLILWMDNSGKINFGIGTGAGTIQLTSPLAYNDGNYHHAVGVIAPNGNMTIYVDGSSVASNANTNALTSYSGFWRIGCIGTTNISFFSNAPTSKFLNGTIDEPAVYYSALSATKVLTHYDAGLGLSGSITGDVPALGRLIITEGQAVDQWWLTFGVQSRYYSSSADAALFYEAEGRTALGGSATAVGPTGASGAGSNVMRSAALMTSYVAILSTQATAAGNHLAHVGDYQVYARVQVPATNTGALAIALEWSQGDFLRVTRNDAVTLPANTWDATWRLINLGQVGLQKVATGTQRWEGRIVASSTVAGDTIDVDYLMFVPITEGSGIVKAVWNPVSPSTFSGRDAFNQTAGALNGKTADVGGTWATSGGPATDFNVTGGGLLQRTAVSDVGGGRYAALGTTTFTNASVAGDLRFSTTASQGGLVARFTDNLNHVRLIAEMGDTGTFWELIVNVAGVPTSLGTMKLRNAAVGGGDGGGIPNTWYRAELHVFGGGRVMARALDINGNELASMQSFDARLATGGALASGKSGLFDWLPNSTATTRSYDNFASWVLVPDAAVFASRQAEIRWDRVIRQDSTGVVWADKAVQGDYLLIPPSGREGRTTEILVKGCRNDPAAGPDSGIDDISAQLVYTPRFLTLPE